MFGTMAKARALLLLGVALGTIGCDRVTKHAASEYLAANSGRSFLSDTIRFGYVENTGGFLSLGAALPPIARDAVFTVTTGIALIALLRLALRRRYAGSAELGLVLFIAGGASNWIDRVLRGSVVDFLNMGIGPFRTGVFNMADVAIMLGAALLVLGQLSWNQKSGNRAAGGTCSAAPSTGIGPG
jgi:signal peptidase II